MVSIVPTANFDIRRPLYARCSRCRWIVYSTAVHPVHIPVLMNDIHLCLFCFVYMRFWEKEIGEFLSCVSGVFPNCDCMTGMDVSVNG